MRVKIPGIFGRANCRFRSPPPPSSERSATFWLHGSMLSKTAKGSGNAERNAARFSYCISTKKPQQLLIVLFWQLEWFYQRALLSVRMCCRALYPLACHREGTAMHRRSGGSPAWGLRVRVWLVGWVGVHVDDSAKPWGTPATASWYFRRPMTI